MRSAVNTATHDSTNAYGDDHTAIKSGNFLSRNASTTEHNNDFRGLKGRNNYETNMSFEKSGQHVSSKNLKVNEGTKNDETVG